MVYGDEEIGIYRDSYENGRSGRMGRSFCVGDLRLSGKIAGGEGLGIGNQGRCGANSRAPLFNFAFGSFFPIESIGMKMFRQSAL